MPFKKHPSLKQIPEKSKIWRYITLARFISLLQRKQLYFHNIRGFDDPFEGRYTPIDFDPEKNPNYRIAFNNAKIDLDMEKAKFINAWHISDFESEAMWELYTNKKEGIAIQSTYSRIKNSFKSSEEIIYIGKVRYLDRRNELTDLSDKDGILVNFVKDISYEFEKELRVLLYLPKSNDQTLKKDNTIDTNTRIKWDNALKNGGIYVQTDLDELIEGILISPFAEKWFTEVVESILEKYKIGKNKLLKSSFSWHPMY
jgi:hypothetical protein